MAKGSAGCLVPMGQELVNRAPLRGAARGTYPSSRLVAYGAAGLAAGLASAALGAAAGLASLEADASGADGADSSDLLQAAPKNRATSARSRTLRIASSLKFLDTIDNSANTENGANNTIRKGQLQARWSTTAAGQKITAPTAIISYRYFKINLRSLLSKNNVCGGCWGGWEFGGQQALFFRARSGALRQPSYGCRT